jgi:hypothetical protein
MLFFVGVEMLIRVMKVDIDKSNDGYRFYYCLQGRTAMRS